MICRNCSYILFGSEEYCPHCGVKCEKQTESEEREETKDEIKKEEIARDGVSLRENEEREKVKASRDTDIFSSEPVYVYSREYDSREKGGKRKYGLALTFLLSFIICVVGIGAFIAAEYFGFIPTISLNFPSRQPEETTTEPPSLLVTTTRGSFSGEEGVVPPQISYKPVLCFVSSEGSLTLRKGPSDSYGQLTTLPNGTQVQVIGASITQSEWVYAYVPREDMYGWLCSSFLSSKEAYEEQLSETTTQIQNG